MSKTNWGCATTLLIFFIALLSLFNWQRLPFFLDIYYHLNVMRGFDTAGGIVTHDFWELAPIGYAHLYPPLFHILLLIPYKLGLNLLFIARLFSAISFILTLTALYFTVNCLYSKRLAFFVTMAASIPYTLFLKASITVPANLALIFILLAFLAMEKERRLAASLFLSASFYSHLGLPWMGVLTFLIYGLLNKAMIKSILHLLSLAFLFSSPMLFRILTNLDKFESVLGLKVGESSLVEFYPLLYLFALIGLLKLKAQKIGGRSLFFIALFIGLLPMTIKYRFRLISAEGLLPIVFFAGMGLERCYGFLKEFLKSKKIRPALAGLYLCFFFILINFFCPTISIYQTAITPHQKEGLRVYLRDSTIANLIPLYKIHFRPLEVCLYNKEISKILEIINDNTKEGDIIYSNYTYFAGLFSAFSGRANSLRSFYEVKAPPYLTNKIRAAKMMIWLKDPMAGSNGVLKTYIDKYKFKKITETDLAIILLNQSAPKSKPVKPVVSTRLAFLLLSLVSFLICYDLARARKSLNNLSKSSLE